MIVIISKKDFKNNKSKLLRNGRYGIINGTEDDDIKNLGVVKAGDDFKALQPPEVLVKKSSIGSGIYDKKLNSWLKCQEMSRVVAIAAAMQLSDHGDIDPKSAINKNVFVILSNKAYKALRKELRARFMKLYKLTEEDGPVVIDYKKAYKISEDGDIAESLKAELKKIDKKIDKASDDLKTGEYDIFSDDDIHHTEKKVQKLRKRRKKIVDQLDDIKVENKKVDDISDEVLIRCLKNGRISKSARKKLLAFMKKYHDHNSEDYLRSEY